MNKPKKILIGYDGSACAAAAIEDLRQAGLPDTGEAVVLSVLEDWLPPPSALELVEGVSQSAEMRALARQAATRARMLLPNWTVEAEVGFGSPASAILERADDWKPDLILVGSHGRTAAGRFFFGSVAQKLVHDARCSVRVARGLPEKTTGRLRLLVGVDGSKDSQAAVEAVIARFWPSGTEARIVNACWTVPLASSAYEFAQVAEWIAVENARIQKLVDAAAAQLRQAGLTTSVVVNEQGPKALLLEEAEQWDADCIFVGARGTGRLERLLIGSVSSAVAARAHCSVEVVRVV